MAWNGAGNFQRTNGSFSGAAVWEDDANAGFDIVDSRHDSHDQDLAQGINNCLTKDGQNSPTANLSMNSFKHTNVGDGSARNQYATVGQLQDQGVQAVGSVGGTANAITASMTPNISAYVTGARYVFKAVSTNSGATTLKIDSAPAVAIQRNVAALVGGEIVSGRYYEVVYDGTVFHLLNTTANPLFLDSVNNRVGIGTTAPTYDLELANTATRCQITRFSNDTSGTQIDLAKSRGATVGTNTIVQSGDVLGVLRFAGANGTGFSEAGYIAGWVDGTPGATNDMPGRITFATTADGAGVATERMRITSSGNVGIGTSAPTSALQVSGPIDNTPDAAGVHAGIISGYACIELCDTTGGIIDFTTPGVDVKGRIIYVHSDNAMTFNTNGGEKARITSLGQYLIGKTSAATSGAGSYFDPSTAGYPAILVNCKTWSGNLLALQNHHNGTYVGGINYSDTATSFPTSSDYRLKENIVDIDDALGRVTQLKPCRFNFIIKPDETIDGFIAHEVQAVVPNAVEGEKDAVNPDGSIKIQSVDLSKIVPLLTAAIQELNAKIESLEARVAALEP